MTRAHRLRPLKPGHPFEDAKHVPCYYASSPAISYYFYRRLDDAMALVLERERNPDDVALDVGCFVGVMTMSLLAQHRKDTVADLAGARTVRHPCNKAKSL